MKYDSNSIEVQQVLSAILKNPSISTGDYVKKTFHGDDINERSQIHSNVRSIFEQLLKTKLVINLPNLLERLRFTWIIMRKADSLIKKNKNKFSSTIISVDDIKKMLQGILPVENTHACFLEQLCTNIEIETDGRFVEYYYQFLRSKNPKDIALSLVDNKGNIREKNLNRIIWWAIRKKRDRYVEVHENKEVEVHFTHLVKSIEKELSGWCKMPEASSTLNLTEKIENQINRWLDYSCIQGEDRPDDKTEHIDLVKAFIKANDLKVTLIHPQTQTGSHEENKRISELEAENLNYIEENRKLEEEKRHLQNQLKSSTNQQHLIEKSDEKDNKTKSAVAKELQEFMKIIDSKYSFDILRDVQLGDNHAITIKNFIAHFFYGLRKKGLSSYPSEDEFVLEYNQSGLYQCIGFEVPSGSKVQVKVEKKGWALRSGNRTFPIRKAILRLVKK